MAAVPASAARLVREATGANAAAITTAVAAFEERSAPSPAGDERLPPDHVGRGPDILSDPAFMP